MLRWVFARYVVWVYSCSRIADDKGDAEAIVEWECDGDRVLLMWIPSALNTA